MRPIVRELGPLDRFPFGGRRAVELAVDPWGFWVWPKGLRSTVRAPSDRFLGSRTEKQGIHLNLGSRLRSDAIVFTRLKLIRATGGCSLMGA